MTADQLRLCCRDGRANRLCNVPVRARADDVTHSICEARELCFDAPTRSHSVARMTAAVLGTVTLHVLPESPAGDPLAIVRTDDEIVRKRQTRTLNLLLADRYIAARQTEWRRRRPVQRTKRGYYQRNVEHVLLADKGCGLDVRFGSSGSAVVRGSR